MRIRTITAVRGTYAIHPYDSQVNKERNVDDKIIESNFGT